jgi:beta-lactam-binding protein with PASTA domain
MTGIKKNRFLLYNLLGALLFVFFVFFIVDKLLDTYTHHGEKIKVPVLYGLQLEEAVNLLKETGLRYEVQDSLFEEGKAGNSVLGQNPDTGEYVKEGRIIYLSVNSSVVPKVKMPDLRDKNIKQAIIILESSGLVLGRVDTTRDIAEDAVIEQKYKGAAIAPDTEINQGSVIHLVIGDGMQPDSGPEVPVPDLSDLTVDEVKILMEAYGLYIREIKVSGKLRDTASARVIAQQPAYDPGLSIRSGSGIIITVKQ